MDVQSVLFGTFGGLAIFLFGMDYMSEGLKNMGSESFNKILHSLTKNRVTSILAGMGITCLIQSSSATSVIVVGFVNAGLLLLEQAIAVVLGADIGTTITAWIVSMTGLSKFKITVYALPVIAIGFLIMFVARKRKHKMLGQSLFGFGILFLGLGTMSGGISSIKESDLIMNFFTEYGSNPFLGIMAGTLVTMVIQSSSATIAIVQVMAFQGLFGLEAAIPLFLGADIGTTITAQLAAIGGTKNARTLAMANSLFKIFGVIIFLPLVVTGLYRSGIVHLVPDRISPETGANTMIMVQIAVAHTLFIALNVVIFSTALWPLLLVSAKRMAFTSKAADEDEIRYLDPLLLNTPTIALEQCVAEVGYMTKLCLKNITAAYEAFIRDDLKAATKIRKRENVIDHLQEDITGFLVLLSQQELGEVDSKHIPPLIHSINDAERVGDHAENILELLEIKAGKKLDLSESAKGDLREYFGLLTQQFEAVIGALETRDRALVEEAIRLEQLINSEHDVVAQGHVDRLEKGKCTVQTGVVFLDLVANLEKIGDHLTNIAERVDTTTSA